LIVGILIVRFVRALLTKRAHRFAKLLLETGRADPIS